MTRTSKQEERRNKCPRRPRLAQEKTGTKKDNLPKGYREHENRIELPGVFIPKIR